MRNPTQENSLSRIEELRHRQGQLNETQEQKLNKMFDMSVATIPNDNSIGKIIASYATKFFGRYAKDIVEDAIKNEDHDDFCVRLHLVSNLIPIAANNQKKLNRELEKELEKELNRELDSLTKALKILSALHKNHLILREPHKSDSTPPGKRIYFSLDYYFGQGSSLQEPAFKTAIETHVSNIVTALESQKGQQQQAHPTLGNVLASSGLFGLSTTGNTDGNHAESNRDVQQQRQTHSHP